MAELDTKSFGAMLRQHRLAADLSQEALAEKAEVTPASTSGPQPWNAGYKRSLA